MSPAAKICLFLLQDTATTGLRWPCKQAPNGSVDIRNAPASQTATGYLELNDGSRLLLRVDPAEIVDCHSGVKASEGNRFGALQPTAGSRSASGP